MNKKFLVIHPSSSLTHRLSQFCCVRECYLSHHVLFINQSKCHCFLLMRFHTKCVLRLKVWQIEEWDNILACSGELHQYFDGLNCSEGHHVPLRISCTGQSDYHENIECEERWIVYPLVGFLTHDCMKLRFKQGSETVQLEENDALATNI